MINERIVPTTLTIWSISHAASEKKNKNMPLFSSFCLSLVSTSFWLQGLGFNRPFFYTFVLCTVVLEILILFRCQKWGFMFDFYKRQNTNLGRYSNEIWSFLSDVNFWLYLWELVCVGETGGLCPVWMFSYTRLSTTTTFSES